MYIIQYIDSSNYKKKYKYFIKKHSKTNKLKISELNS